MAKKKAAPKPEAFEKRYPLPAEPNGEGRREKIEEALGYPKTAVFESSPVTVRAVNDELVVRVAVDEEPDWSKVAPLVK